MDRKTIVMLSAKRCGSTAMFRVFQNHPDVGVCHVDPTIANWEPNFWNLGAQAIAGAPERFVERFAQSHPFLRIPAKFTEETVFDLWDSILDRLGPVVFDKSPQYLGDRATFDLLQKYQARGNDVRLFAVIRDPRDAITSQFELWNKVVAGDSPTQRETDWLHKYEHLEELQRSLTIPLVRYEDFAEAPSVYAYGLFKHCGCAVVPEAYAHIRPTSVGRYSGSIEPAIRQWRFSRGFQDHLKKYGYRIPQHSRLERLAITARMFRENRRRRRSAGKSAQRP